ncbi:MAG TPA: hypothetical protein VFU32_03335 [Ktedonobacterales bacterium]|nr:hypothetical protein [Ktedonobacterales bacterium]
MMAQPQSLRCFRLLGMLLLLALAGCGGSPTSAQSSAPGEGSKTPLATATALASSSPTSTPAISWQSYQDSHYSFSVQYPEDWMALQDAHVDENPPYEVVSFYPGSSQSAPAIDVISITVAEQQPDDLESGPPAGFAPAGDVTIAGATEKMFSGPGANGGQELLVEHDQGNYAYLFLSNADTTSAAAFKQNLMKLLASFQVQA